MNYKIILFDFDGTLADSAAVVNSVMEQLIEKYHFIKVTPKELKHKKTNSLWKKFQMLFFMARIQKEFKHRYGQNVEKIELYDGIMDVLSTLQKSPLKTDILSSNSAENIQSFFETKQILFDGEIVASKGLFGKHKTIQDFLKRHGYSAKDVLYIGDELRDIKACNKAGIDVMFVRWGLDSKEDISHLNVVYTANTPTDILAFLHLAD